MVKTHIGWRATDEEISVIDAIVESQRNHGFQSGRSDAVHFLLRLAIDAYKDSNPQDGITR